MEARPYKIPQSVLVVIYREDGQVLLLRRSIAAPEGEPFWQSVTGSKDSLDEDWRMKPPLGCSRKPASMRWRRTVA